MWKPVATSSKPRDVVGTGDAVRRDADVDAPGPDGVGVYICITPNRVSGPHDVSRGFDEVATGFHMHEYTGREIRPLVAR